MDSPQPRKHVCVGCAGEITDQYVLRVAPDLEWHASCLKCTECQQSLDENCTCFVREGKTYCKEDYIRLFGTKCAKCGCRFTKSDLVMRAKNSIYHLHCFSCVSCGRQLIPGDEFALREEGLLCRADHDALERSINAGNYDYVVGVGGGVGPTDASSGGEHEDSRTEPNNNEDSKIVSTDSTSSHGSSSPVMHHGPSSRNAPSSGHGGSGPAAGGHFHQHHHHHHHHGRTGSGRGHHQKGEQKTTRIRTVLNEKQLHTLRTCYSANSRPDALMKEQLVEMTGLSPRVIRVWFQNKRCKDKKRSIVLKQLQQQQQNKNDKCMLDESSWLTQKGIPLIATSPVRHDPPNSLQTSPVDVEKYAAPWTTTDLTDLHSLQMEMEKQATATCTPFQQLMNSFGDSFDDDTVVSFDELSDGNNGGARMIHHQQQQQQRGVVVGVGPSQGIHPHPPLSAYAISGHY